jgi:hypothetical protein
MHDKSWEKIYNDLEMDKHDFDKMPFTITAEQIKTACQDFKTTGEKEVRILCKQDTREDRPNIFRDNGLFILPVQNGIYAIIKGEGYIDIPKIVTDLISHDSILDFSLDTSKIGNSEMQHLDFAYASSIIRSFMEDRSLVLTIRGRKYTPKFDFIVGSHKISVNSVQTEVDAGYEGTDSVVLVEAKNANVDNTIIRQLYYPYRQWQSHTLKKVSPIFFDKKGKIYSLWQFEFSELNNYSSIKLVKSKRYTIE